MLFCTKKIDDRVASHLTRAGILAFGNVKGSDATAIARAVGARRLGTVMDIERYFHRAGQNPEIDGPRANYVRIVHDDGSMGVYAHLDYNGVIVRPGQQVEAGQQIGRSGNTGFSTGPHLHFAVQVNRDMELVSIPFEMLDHDGTPLTFRR